MKRKIAVAAAVAAAAALALSACTGSGGSSNPSASSGPVTLSVAGWSLATTPEFKLLADGFHKKYPNITIDLKEYDPTQYSTLITADLAAGKGPDIITQKEVKYVPTFVQGGQLLDVSDLKLPKGLNGVDSYKVDGKQYAVPYRQDSWVLYYNKDLFDKAGVSYPDGSWTWEDYDKAAVALSKGAGGAKGAYQHTWQSTVQGFATAQAGGNDFFKADYSYMKPYYDRVLALQKDGAQVDFNTATANKLTYQGEFGKQKAAMLPMGTWYIATLIAQQKSGDSDKFKWGIAPIPQESSKTAGLKNTPVTFGDPAGFGINAGIDGSKKDAAEKFLQYSASETAAKDLAAAGLTPALTTTSAADELFAIDGAPNDDLSKFAWKTHTIKPENPTSEKTAAIQGILNDMNTAILSGSSDVNSAIKDADQRVKNEVGVD